MLDLQKSDAIYQQIANYLEKEIVEGKVMPGDKIPATRKLATRFNVNPNTIQQSLKLMMKRGLIDRKPGRGTYVRHGVNNKTAGIIFGKQIYTNPEVRSFSAILDSIVKLFEANDWNCRLFSTSGGNVYDKAFHDLKAAVSSGEVKCVIELCSNDLIKEWAMNECPVPYAKTAMPTDYIDFTITGLNYLKAHGCTRIAYLAHLFKGHEKAYDQAFKSLEENNGLSRDMVRMAYCDPRLKEGYNAIMELFKGKCRPDGILVGNDAVFQGALYALLKLGLEIPDDVKLVTHANKGVDLFCHVPLTRLEFNLDDYAKMIYDKIMCKVTGKKYTYEDARAKLVPGKSCGEK